MGARIYITSGRGRKSGTHICIISGRGRKTVGASAPTAPIRWAPLFIELIGAISQIFLLQKIGLTSSRRFLTVAGLKKVFKEKQSILA